MKIETKFDKGDIVYCILQEELELIEKEDGGYDCETKSIIKEGKIELIRIDYFQEILEILYSVDIKDGWIGYMLREDELFATREEAEKKLVELKGE